MTTAATSDPEQAVRDESIKTFRKLLPIVAPNIAGYEMRALPGLVTEGATRLRDRCEYMERLYREREDRVVALHEEAAALRRALETQQLEMLNFTQYSLSVSAEAVGDRRDMWLERAAWAERLADQARKALNG